MSPYNQEHYDERKEQIMQAALKVFARRGIIGTKMSMIADEARISPGLLYRYFDSKDELFTSLVERAMLGSIENTQSISKLPGSPLEKLKVLTEVILEEENQLYFMLLHQARTSDEVPEKASELIRQYSMAAYVDALKPLFIEGQQAGELAAGDPQKLIAAYLTVLSGLMTLNISESGGNFVMPETGKLLRLISAP